MNKKIYEHGISVPFAGTLEMKVRSPNKNPSDEELFELACEKEWELKLESEDDIYIGEEVNIYERLTRGNWNLVPRSEIDIWNTEEIVEEDI